MFGNFMPIINSSIQQGEGDNGNSEMNEFSLVTFVYIFFVRSNIYHDHFDIDKITG